MTNSQKPSNSEQPRWYKKLRQSRAAVTLLSGIAASIVTTLTLSILAPIAVPLTAATPAIVAGVTLVGAALGGTLGFKRLNPSASLFPRFNSDQGTSSGLKGQKKTVAKQPSKKQGTNFARKILDEQRNKENATAVITK